MIINDIIEFIVKSNRIAITFHKYPDGDSIGSSLALMQGLKQLNKEVYIVSNETVPFNLMFLPFASNIGEKNSIDIKTDCVIVLDCGNVERINAINFSSNSTQYKVVNIDHHVSNDMYGKFNYIRSDASATGEIVYEILNKMHVLIDTNIAECLYTSIITDTGSFKYSNTSKITHQIAGELINTGIDFTKIHRNIFECKPYKKIKLISKVIDSMELYLKNKVCFMTIESKVLNDLDINLSDTGDVIDIGAQIDSVVLVALFKEVNNGTKVSLRSKCEVDVRSIAERFNGGGHPKAAGLTLNLNIETAKKIILDEIKKELV